MSRERLRQIFIEEASEIIEKLDSDIMDLESDPDNSDILNELFRGVHTLKGSANSIGFNRLGTFVHSFEDALDYFRAGSASVDTGVIDTFLEAVDVIKEVFDDDVQQRPQLSHPERFESSLEHIRGLLQSRSQPSTILTNDQIPLPMPPSTPEPAPQPASPAHVAPPASRPSQQAYQEVLRDLAEEFDNVGELESIAEPSSPPPTISSTNSGTDAPTSRSATDAGEVDIESLHRHKQPGANLYHIQLTLDSDIYIRGYDHATFLRLLREQGTILAIHWDLSPVGELESIDPLRCDIGAVDIYVASDQPMAEISEIFEFLDDFEYSVRLLDEVAPATTPTPKPVAPVEPSPASEIATATPPFAAQSAPAPVAANPSPAPASGTDAPSEARAESADKAEKGEVDSAKPRDEKRSFVRIDTKKLDELFDSVGELVIAQSFLTQNPTIQGIADEHVKKTLDVLSKITRLIQNRVMSLRMVPIRDTFEKMRRVVRDAARKIDKDIMLHISGEETEIDKNMVDALGDPLIHLIRNAIDHGMESDPTERTRLGKEAQGSIFLRAFHKGGSIVIEISDDGRGINRDKVLQKAIKQGLVNADEELSDSQVYSLIMQAGFSTAEAISDLSGRGVGLDVVRSSVEHLRGKVEIHSTPGQGTTFSLHLPLTLAIIDGMLVRCAHETFIIPTLSILESFQPSNDNVFTYQGKGEFVKLREEILPIVRLEEVLSIKGEKRLKAHEATLVHVENDNGHFALLVDELISRQQVVIKPIGEGSIRVPQVSGAAVMGNGMVSLILNVEGLY